MTSRLYYDNSYLYDFDAHVLECAPAAGRWRVRLDRTAFYPTSGGQPFDTGTLGGASVLEVLEDEATHEIAHITDAPLSVGPVKGSVDSSRRFDHMQQHTGQHILSAAFVSLFNFATVSFHLGRETCTIDLPQMPSPAQLRAAEQRANDVVFQNRAVEVIYGTAAELEELGIRKAVNREGVLRAVVIQDFDRQPCGGTHVARTGEVGMILLRKTEKQKQNCRIEFVCGHRVLRFARSDYEMLVEAARQLSCAPGEVAPGIRRASEEYKAVQKRCEDLQAHVARLEAAELLRSTGPASPRRIAKLFEDAGPAHLRLLATQLVAHGDVQAFLATRAGGHVVFAQSAGLGDDMSRRLRDALAAHGGKGGGTRDFAQGNAPITALQDILSRLD